MGGTYVSSHLATLRMRVPAEHDCLQRLYTSMPEASTAISSPPTSTVRVQLFAPLWPSAPPPVPLLGDRGTVLQSHRPHSGSKSTSCHSSTHSVHDICFLRLRKCMVTKGLVCSICSRKDLLTLEARRRRGYFQSQPHPRTASAVATSCGRGQCR